ncbi:MAG: DUF2262 domain-containing protein [Clostridia bacterium]|nr:DUF2262 domain-containing protein [Clostridia bacterium]
MGILKQKITVSKEFKNYVKTYLKDKCEGKILKITALTGFLIHGAAKLKGDEFYRDNIKCIAYINNDQVSKKEIRLTYFLDNTTPLNNLKLDDLTPYIFEVKKLKDNDVFYVVKVKGKSKTNKFDTIIEEQSKPLVITEEDTTFNYDRTFDWYNGKVNIENKNISIMLYPETNTTDATESLNTFKKIKNDFKNFYHKVLSQCSKDIRVMANDWREDGDTHEITSEEIYKRIDNDFDIEIRGKDYTIYFNDDDLFWGHTILYNGNIENNIFDTTIAG